jgi:hypothetical protein
MAKPITIPNTFANATTAIPLSQLDNNYSTITSAINDANTYSNYAADSGAANAYTVTLSGVTTTYSAGLRIQFKAANNNSGASTLNVNSQGTKNIFFNNAALSANVIQANAVVDVIYDGTQFQMLSVNGTTPTAYGTVTNVSVTSANGFTGTVATSNTTPNITITTSITGVLKGNGTAISAATAGTDYLAPPSGTALLKANSGGALANATAGTDYLAPPSGTSLLKANSGGALANATAGTDYLAPPSGTSLLKANSGGALANATAGTDYVAPNVATTFTAAQTFTGSTSNIAISMTNATEPATVSATAATGNITYDLANQSVLYYTSNASANWNVLFRYSSGTTVNNAITANTAITAAFLVQQGATAYYNANVYIDGTQVTPKWQGGTAPTSGNANAVDAYTYTIVKTAANAYTVFASQTQFK